MSHWSNSSHTRTHSSLSFSHIHSADRQKNLLFQIVIECPGSYAGKGGETGAGDKVTRGAFTVLQRISLAFFPICTKISLSHHVARACQPAESRPVQHLASCPIASAMNWRCKADGVDLCYIFYGYIGPNPLRTPVQPSLVAIKRSSYVIVQGRRSSRERERERARERGEANAHVKMIY